jgi:hypothetical protein
MNAGMRDAINLSWKLPLVVNGTAPDTLLDSYQAERHGHAHDLIDWAVSIGKLMDHMTEQFRAQQEGRDPPPDPDLQSSGYGQGREQPPISDGLICADQLGADGSTGYLFRQPIIRQASGAEARLDDLLGPGFAVVGKDASALTINKASEAILDKLGATRVAISGLTLVKGKFDALFSTSAAAIIRPDRLVFGCTTDTVSLDHLVGELGRQMEITT